MAKQKRLRMGERAFFRDTQGGVPLVWWSSKTPPQQHLLIPGSSPSDSSYLACAPQVAEGATLVLIEFVDQ